MRTALLALVALAGCGWNHLPHQSRGTLDAPFWDPYGIVPTRRGLYVPGPASGHLFWVPTEGEPRRVGIRPGNLVKVEPIPGGNKAVAFLERFRCEPEDPRDARGVEQPEDCPYDALVVTAELAVLWEGRPQVRVEIPRHFDRVEFSDDGGWAIAFLAFDGERDPEGVVNLTSVLAIDVETEQTYDVAVGFAADRVLFTPDGTRAVVLSQSSVAVVDLTLEIPETVVTFPLTLDPDQLVDPVGVDLTPDGRYALISVQGAGDLYVLDLENHSVNLLSLRGSPAAMYVDDASNQTVLVYGSASAVDVIDHAFFDVETIDVDEPSNHIVAGDGFVLLYDDRGNHDVYRLDLATHDVVEYRLQNPALSVHLAPTGEYAVALTRAEGGSGSGADAVYDRSPGMEILDLRPGEDDTYPYLLEQPGLGVEFVATDTELRALVLQQGVDYLYQLDLYTLAAEEIELELPPLTIGSVPDGPFFITHDDGLGLITFLDPVSGEMTTAAGFAWNGWLFELGLDEEGR